jgi:hypothetical protein
MGVEKMRIGRQLLSGVLCAAMTAVTALPQEAFTGDHVVPLNKLHEKAQASSEQRSRNIADIQRVLSYPAAAAALQKSNVNPDQMRRAVATLSDDELTRMADRARSSEHDVQGGFIVGILALIGLIVVIIIVVTVVAENDMPAAHLETAA